MIDQHSTFPSLLSEVKRTMSMQRGSTPIEETLAIDNFMSEIKGVIEISKGLPRGLKILLLYFIVTDRVSKL